MYQTVFFTRIFIADKIWKQGKCPIEDNKCWLFICVCAHRVDYYSVITKVENLYYFYRVDWTGGEYAKLNKEERCFIPHICGK